MRIARFFLVPFVTTSLFAAEVTLVDNGQPKAAVFVSERIWDDAVKNPEPEAIGAT
jgi:hypothetical protein